jgi:hypothetical protein
MIFEKEQIQEILRVISFNHTLFIGTNIGYDLLTKEDKKELQLYGIDPESIKTDFTPFEQQFYFGRLSAALGDKNTKNISYNDFLKYLRRGQYNPLSEREQAMLDYAKQKTYGHIKGLGDKITQTVNGFIIEEDQAKRDKYEETIKNSIERAIIERDTVNSIVSEIGNKMNDWSIDLGRIAATEMENVFQQGRASEVERRYGKDHRVYKEVFPQACRHCIKAYTTNGIGSKPKVFKLSELRANGTNIGKKQSNWLPVLGTVHPFCRCILYNIPEGYVWDEEKKQFIPPKYGKEEKFGVKIMVGDKTFNV